VSSPFLVIVSVQVPADDADSLLSITVHLAVPDVDTTYVTDPVPAPPVKSKEISTPTVPVVTEPILPVVDITFVNVNVAVTDSDTYDESDAFVTVRAHVPADLAVTTPEIKEQLAVPVVTVDVVAPDPEPPVVETIIPVIKSPVVIDTARAV
jgi:hypothetical protein